MMHSFIGVAAWRASTKFPRVWDIADDSMKWGSARVGVERMDSDEHGLAKGAMHRHMV
jgi:hypothetical protein